MPMNSLHVVHQIVVAGEAVAWDGALATLVFAGVWLVAVAVQAVCFAFVAKQAGGR